MLAVALTASMLFVLTLGSVGLPAEQVWNVVARRCHLPYSGQVTVLDDRIIWQLRLPRVMAAAAVGAILAQCGAVLQSLTGNDLADPYLLGISSGASVGAVGAIVLGWSIPGLTSTASISILAFVGALASLILVLLLATDKSGALPPERTILSGIAVAQIAAAFTTLVVMVFADKDGMRSVSVWTLGSFAGVRIPDGLFVVIVAFICILGLIPAARILDAFAFGETTAQTLGVNVVKARWILLIGCALATAGTVAAVGPIGFVGLMIPHGVRLLVGPKHRALLPLSALAGGLLMVWADTVARSIVPGREIPIGVVTSALGAPVLVFLLRWRGKSR